MGALLFRTGICRGCKGIDLLKACKADARFKDTPFMLVTAESEQKHILEAAKAGVSDYVVKPFNSATLKGKNGARLGQAQSWNPSESLLIF